MFNFLRKIISEKSPVRFAYYFVKSFMAAIIYGLPGQKIKVIGVTGTDGKTTVNLITHILNHAGILTGMISTTAFQIGDEKIINKTKRTSVSPFLLHKMLRKMLQKKCEYVVLEVSSHALEQKRFWGIAFDIAVLTNITPEHLDYHSTMEEYQKIKSILFQGLTKSKIKSNQKKTMVLNYSDPVYEKFNQFSADEKLSYGLTKKADFFANRIKLNTDKSDFNLHYKNEEIAISLPLVGEFNIENALAAASATYSIGLSFEQIKLGLENFSGVEGRMEKIDEGQNFNVIVDFALTPEALRKLFATAKKITQGKIIGVLGCTGDRDQTKRPIVGQMATEMLDVFILTDDETYTENGDKIRNEIKLGIQQTNKKIDQDWYEISDRLKAIRFALKIAKKNDTILIPGMGAEYTRNMGGKEIEWDEREIVRTELRKL